jgi:hypothetical protein
MGEQLEMKAMQAQKDRLSSDDSFNRFPPSLAGF